MSKYSDILVQAKSKLESVLTSSNIDSSSVFSILDKLAQDAADMANEPPQQSTKNQEDADGEKPDIDLPQTESPKGQPPKGQPKSDPSNNPSDTQDGEDNEPGEPSEDPSGNDKSKQTDNEPSKDTDGKDGEAMVDGANMPKQPKDTNNEPEEPTDTQDGDTDNGGNEPGEPTDGDNGDDTDGDDSLGKSKPGNQDPNEPGEPTDDGDSSDGDGGEDDEPGEPGEPTNDPNNIDNGPQKDPIQPVDDKPEPPTNVRHTGDGLSELERQSKINQNQDEDSDIDIDDLEGLSKEEIAEQQKQAREELAKILKDAQKATEKQQEQGGAFNSTIDRLNQNKQGSEEKDDWNKVIDQTLSAAGVTKTIKVDANTAAVAMWKKQFRKLFENASGITSVRSPSREHRRIEGAFGADIDVPVLEHIVLTIDESVSMGVDKFKMCLAEIGNIIKSMPKSQKLKITVLFWANRGVFKIAKVKGRGMDNIVNAIKAVDPRFSGGTEPTSSFVKLSKVVNKKFDVIIHMSDFEMPWDPLDRDQECLRWMRSINKKSVYVVPSAYDVRNATSWLKSIPGSAKKVIVMTTKS